MVIDGMGPDFKKPQTVIGLDTSSTGVAWTCLEDGNLKAQGKIKLDKIKTINHKLAVVYHEWPLLLEELNPDYLFIEKSIFVKNPATARILSYVVGSIICISEGEGYPITDVEPAVWKSFMGYTNLSSKFVSQAKEKLGPTEGKKLCDRLRKSQTWRVIQHNYPQQAEGSLAEGDHDIADSWGIALYGYDKMGAKLNLEKSKQVAIDQEELRKMGLAL